MLISSPDAGHSFLALDDRAPGPPRSPAVTWADTEGPLVLDLAPSFRAFVEALRPSESFPSMIALRAELAEREARRRRPFWRRRC